MQYPYLALAPEYTALISRMVITRQKDVDAAATKLIGFIDHGEYAEGCRQTGVPEIWAAASFEREASSDFTRNPAQGWPLNQVSKIEPHNGPFPDWTSAQIAAYKIDHLNTIGAANWDWPRACYEAELFNGFGPRAHGHHSGYLFSGSDIYDGGKYVSDGVWNPDAIDSQLGVVPMMVRMVQLRPDLDLAKSLPRSIPHGLGAPPPAPAPTGLRAASDLQSALNKLGCNPPLTVDGSYGRFTRNAVMAYQKLRGLEVDGVAGPETWVSISNDLKTRGA